MYGYPAARQCPAHVYAGLRLPRFRQADVLAQSVPAADAIGACRPPPPARPKCSVALAALLAFTAAFAFTAALHRCRQPRRPAQQRRADTPNVAPRNLPPTGDRPHRSSASCFPFRSPGAPSVTD
eukprot:scaffold21569_cov107-Isochrysis_galbana.AAC.7